MVTCASGTSTLGPTLRKMPAAIGAPRSCPGTWLPCVVTSLLGRASPSDPAGADVSARSAASAGSRCCSRLSGHATCRSGADEGDALGTTACKQCAQLYNF